MRIRKSLLAFLALSMCHVALAQDELSDGKGAPAPRATCCPPGPPYEPACSESYYYYFHGNQLYSISAEQMLAQSPWRHTGRVTLGSGAATGVLIHPNFVLTAAHAVTKGGQLPDDGDAPWFRLAQPCESCLPYGARTADRVWVPQEWLDNVGGSYDSMETRAYDWALLELDLDAGSFNDGVPDPEPMPVSSQVFSSYDHLAPRAMGYACGKQADGADRKFARPYATDASATFLGQELFPKVGGAGGGSLLRTSLEGTAGMSGGPVWVEIDGVPQLVGVLIGSPQAACDDGENWVAGLSPNTRERIISVIGTGAAPGMAWQGFMFGGGGYEECKDLFEVLGACNNSFGSSSDAGCGNPERSSPPLRESAAGR